MLHALIMLLALLIGVVAGLRALVAPGVVAWAAFLGWLPVTGTWAQWVASPVTVAVLTVVLLVELVTDQLPSTPSRLVAAQFLPRIVVGGFAGAVIGSGWHWTFTCIGAGMIGAVLGTMAGFHVRRILVAGNGGRDLPVAVTEDAIAVLGGFAVVATAATLAF